MTPAERRARQRRNNLAFGIFAMWGASMVYPKIDAFDSQWLLPLVIVLATYGAWSLAFAAFPGRGGDES